MTRKDYVAIAGAIKYTRQWNKLEKEVYATDRVAESIAGVMALDNPSFDRARFLKACGIQA